MTGCGKYMYFNDVYILDSFYYCPGCGKPVEENDIYIEPVYSWQWYRMDGDTAIITKEHREYAPVSDYPWKKLIESERKSKA